MSLLDGPMGDMAATLLDTVQLGTRPATLRRPGSGGGYDPATGQITGGGSPTDFSCRIALEDFRDDQIDGTLIQQGDRMAIVSRKTLGTKPVPDSDVLIEGADPGASGAVTWQVKRVLGISSGEQDAAYRLHLRR